MRCVYFIQAGESGPIKIGEADDVPQRLRELQTGNPEELRLLGLLAWRPGLEVDLHCRFYLEHVRGEWFRPAPELLAFIAELCRESPRLPAQVLRRPPGVELARMAISREALPRIMDAIVRGEPTP